MKKGEKKYGSNWDTVSLILINFGDQPTAKITCGTMEDSRGQCSKS